MNFLKSNSIHLKNTNDILLLGMLIGIEVCKTNNFFSYKLVSKAIASHIITLT